MNKIAYTAFVAFVSVVATLAAVHVLSEPPASRKAPVVPYAAVAVPGSNAEDASETSEKEPSEEGREGREKKETGPRVITQEELARHDKPDDCWMAIHGKVYDFTAYIPKHPTPPAIMHKWCGKDATEGWETKGYGRPHSKAAEAMLDEYFIGVLQEREKEE